jgi:hypothetical protein
MVTIDGIDTPMKWLWLNVFRGFQAECHLRGGPRSGRPELFIIMID